VLRPGGELDGLGQQALGEPSFEVGERVVLFLQRRGHVYRVLGMSQGLFRVDGAGTAVQDIRDLALAQGPGPEEDGSAGRRAEAKGRSISIGGHGEGGEPPLPLAALKRRVLAQSVP
jgi:hypothetical protein